VALQEKMAASEHSRTVELAPMPGSSWRQGNPSPFPACISVRMWPASGTAESPLPLADSQSPAVWLVLDLIAASGGVPVASRGEVLVAGFPSLQTAIFTARRLQWAVQGFCEAGEPQAASLAVLVHSGEDAPDLAAGAPLLLPGEQATPGEILLTQKARQAFENLPGLPMMAAPGDDLRELLWRGPEEQATRSFDEQMLSLFIEEQGPRSQPQEEPQPTVIAEASPAADGRTGSHEQFVPEPAPKRSHWGMGIAALAAVALAAGGFFYWQHEKTAPAPDQTQAPVQTQAPAQTQTPPAAETNAPAAQGPQPPSTSPAQPAKLTHAEAQAAAKAARNAAKNPPQPAEQQAAQTPQPERPQPVKAQPEAPRGHCDLESSQYAGQIDQAWKNLGRGKYADAKREFGAVLACDPGNGRAKEGLERARMAASEADGGSN